MKISSITKFLAVSTLIAFPAHADLGPVISPAELADELQNNPPLILDIRSLKAPEGKEEVGTYTAGHIPGAVSAPYGRFRGPRENPGQLLTEGELTSLFQELGITHDRHVVVVHQGNSISNFGAAARVYWTLKSAGLESLSLLNGGVDGWTEAGLELSTEPVEPSPSTIEVSFSDQWLAEAKDIEAVISGSDEALLVDARTEEFWLGDKSHPAAARPGTIPGSINFVHSSWFGGSNSIPDSASVLDLAGEQGFTSAPKIVSFCNTGHWAATNWFALSEVAGLDNVKLYAESMVGWSNAGNEMDNVPGAFSNLLKRVKSTN